ncbi:hypothetical protein [Adhaeribacter soli]|uniref:Cell surface protein SprA n=1 Tax=Adhaeribacter soli TaxID=2607655 RepID=A0A5N1IMJ6_9BACT|nr:hypothetical protein [Adhaeribacter soli]KAA9325964.1 hypothetical protein F0P94_16195 [Adhaeribacter soli]
MQKRLGLFFFLILLSQFAFAQISSKRCKWVKVTEQRFKLDSLTLLPGSVQFFNNAQEELKYNYNPTTNEFSFVNVLWPDSILVCYRVLPLNLGKPYYKRDLLRMDSISFERAYAFEDFSVREELFRTPGLNKSGSYTRGLSFGNTQNVFVNSALNLQLEGKLSEDINIIASVTDQNIPFQPEGNTQQLQEFDRVFITLQHRRWTLTGGDVVLRNKPSNFLRFYKNVQGGALEVFSEPKENRGSATSVAAAVAKGKFASQNITPIESVQGPYRLNGVNGDKFIIVLANSERVYLDGRLLQRGFDYDYTIDYNQAEVTFMPKNLITRNTRIRIDFEYSDQNYSRSVTHLSHYQTLNKLKLQVNYYNEADNPNNPNQIDLKNDQKKLLAQIGDDVSKAVISGADSVAFDPKQILYDKRDTVINGMQIVYFKESQNPNEAFFTVRFSDVGQGNGDYVQKATSINGRVYEFVGTGQGRYLPVRQLPLPIKKQMMTAGASYQVTREATLYAETALSEFDLNRFSRVDAEDDKGRAMKVGYEVLDKELAGIRNYKLRSTLNYEYTDDTFEPIDRYRDIEFERDWSLPANAKKVNDNILNFSAGLFRNEKNLVNYRISKRYRQGEVNGLQHWLDAAQEFGKLELKGTFFLLNNTVANAQSDWVRGDLGAKYNWGKIVPGYVYRFDKNKLTLPTRPDSVIGSANFYDEHVFFVQNSDSANVRYRLDYTRRDDYQPREGELLPRDLSNTYNASLNTRIGQNNDLNLLLTYREITSNDTIHENTILARTDWNGDFLDRHLRSEVSYTVATGREQKREYIFVETVHGQGTHYLREGGNPKNLNDYFEAQTPAIDKRTHIKVFLPSDEYITAFTNTFTYRLSGSMPRNWEGQKGWRDFASRFNSLTYISIDKKTTDKDLMNRLNPFSQDIEDLFLISLSKSLRNTLYYNRSNPKFGMEGTMQQAQQKVLLSNGTDTRNQNTQTVISRYNLNELFASKLNLERGVRESSSSYLTSRNFRIEGYTATPEVAYQPNTNLRFTVNYSYSKKQNMIKPEALPGEEEQPQEEAVFHELGLDTRLSQVSKRTVTAAIKYIRIGFTGDENSAVGYEILNTLRPGNNATWNVSVQQRLSNGLNISLIYDGRKPDAIRAIHTGRAQVSVLF